MGVSENIKKDHEPKQQIWKSKKKKNGEILRESNFNVQGHLLIECKGRIQTCKLFKAKFCALVT